MVRMGRYCEIGEARERDQPAAAAWFRKAAVLGNADGAFHLARCYEFGVGMEKDESAAVGWHLEATEAGCPCASWKELSSVFTRRGGLERADS
jgi:TPR repeat protein